MTVRNVIFDLGGVLMNLHFDRSELAFQKLGSQRFREQWSLSRQTQLFDDFETGKISETAFRDGLRRALDVSASDTELDAAWNAMLGDIPPARLAYVRALRPRYRTFLLSNTNSIHLAHVFKHCHSVHGERDLDAFFERTHYSHALGHRKPTPEAFQVVLDANGLVAAETLFVDDLQANVLAARASGLQSTLVPLGADLALLLGKDLP